ncbi:hypothetical protein [Rhodococcoides kyotonense]|uniref:Uncharacterized protein n=1 Tax=Rhodococcoides kyotonense TaxID=398843 RepID=A0A177YET0_9NOCA|nr:hypothetical protein [Rhodococcus kyotonensis]OAK54007.1 hypothetical protein A3K89_21100 [Rhodococcus kyotonensis]
MEETSRTLIATTSQVEDERHDTLVAVTVRYGTKAIDYMLSPSATTHEGIRSSAHELLGIYGYEVTGEWTDIAADGATWQAPVAGVGDGLGCGGICPDCGPPPA